MACSQHNLVSCENYSLDNLNIQQLKHVLDIMHAHGAASRDSEHQVLCLWYCSGLNRLKRHLALFAQRFSEGMQTDKKCPHTGRT